MKCARSLVSLARPVPFYCALLALTACGSAGDGLIERTFAELDALCDQAVIAVNTESELMPGSEGMPGPIRMEDQNDETCGPGEPCTLRAALNSAYVCRNHPEPGSVKTIRLQPETTYTLSEAYLPSVEMKRPEAAQAKRVGDVLLPRIFGNVVIEGEGATIQVDRALRDSPSKRRFFHVVPGASLTLRNMTLAEGGTGDPSATDPTAPPEALQGGALFNEGRLVLDDVTFLLTSTAHAIHNHGAPGEPGADARANRCAFEANRGAISNAAGGTFVVDACTFVSNFEGRVSGGGAIHVDGGSLTTQNGTLFSDNYGLDASVILMESGVLNLSATTFEGNAPRSVIDGSLYGGPPIAVRGGTVSVDQCTFNHNGGRAGAMLVTGGALTSTRSTFFANTAALNWSGAIWVDGGASVRLEDVTIHANGTESGVGVGGLRVGGGSRAELSNTVFSNNTLRNCRLDLAPTIHNRCMSTDDTCEGAVQIADPMFVGSLRNNGGPTATLLPSGGTVTSGASPLVDAGTDARVRVDQRGQPRPVGAGSDVGAVERQAVEAP